VAADGSRYAAVHGTESSVTKTNAEIEAYITSKAAGLDKTNLTVTVTYNPNIRFTGSRVTVVVDYDLNLFLSGLFETVTGGTIADFTLSAESTMTVL